MCRRRNIVYSCERKQSIQLAVRTPNRRPRLRTCCRTVSPIRPAKVYRLTLRYWMDWAIEDILTRTLVAGEHSLRRIAVVHLHRPEMRGLSRHMHHPKDAAVVVAEPYSSTNQTGPCLYSKDEGGDGSTYVSSNTPHPSSYPVAVESADMHSLCCIEHTHTRAV